MSMIEDDALVKEFARRTRDNLFRIEQDGDYEVTQLINSLLGLLVIPEQKCFEKLSKVSMDSDFIKQLQFKITKNSYSNEDINLEFIARHLRNAICHGGIKFIGDGKNMIVKVLFTDDYKGKVFSVELDFKDIHYLIDCIAKTY